MYELSEEAVGAVKFQYFWRHLNLWLAFDEEGHFKASFEKYDNLQQVKGQMFNPKTQVWSVISSETGKIIDGLESKKEYSPIEKLPEDKSS